MFVFFGGNHRCFFSPSGTPGTRLQPTGPYNFGRKFARKLAKDNTSAVSRRVDLTMKKILLGIVDEINP